MFYKILLFSFFSFAFFELEAKVRVLTFHYNKPHFFEWQCLGLKKFCQDDYELFIFSDAPKAQIRKFFEKIASIYEARFFHYEDRWHYSENYNHVLSRKIDTPKKNSWWKFPLQNGFPDENFLAQQCSVRHCHVIQYALEYFGYDHDDIVVIMDGDLFPIKPFSFSKILGENHLSGINADFQFKYHYPWVPLIIFKPSQMPDVRSLKFGMGFIEENLCDSGSQSYEYLKKYPEIKYFLSKRKADDDFRPFDGRTFEKMGIFHEKLNTIQWPLQMEFYVNQTFLHFCGGSGVIYPKKKDSDLKKILDTLIGRTKWSINRRFT